MNCLYVEQVRSVFMKILVFLSHFTLQDGPCPPHMTPGWLPFILTAANHLSVHVLLALRYLVDCCRPVSEVAGRRQLRSASRQYLTVPHYRLNPFGRWAFSVAGPYSWNSSQDRSRDPTLSSDSFRKPLKTELFASY